jgi:hypothetical protein
MDWLHDNWLWLALLILVLGSIERGISSLRNSIIEVREQTQEAVEYLSRIAALMGREEEEKRREIERAKWHELPEPPARCTLTNASKS